MKWFSMARWGILKGRKPIPGAVDGPRRQGMLLLPRHPPQAGEFRGRNRPKVPSQLSQCGGAGTGCGWCIPFLKQIYQQECGAPAAEARTPDAGGVRAAAGRVRPRREGKPPPGATPLPEETG